MNTTVKKPLFKPPSHILIHALLITGSIFMIFPFVWMIMTSFKSEDEILRTGKTIVLLPDLARPSFLNGEEDRKRIAEHQRQKELYAASLASPASATAGGKKVQKPFEVFDNYKEAWAAQPFYRYFLNTFLTAITITTGSLIFASLAAYAFAFFKFPFKDQLFLLMLGTMMLPQQALLIPDYIILSKLHWVNTYMALIVPWLASAYSVFFLRQFFMQLPKDLFEAAMLDGCTRLSSTSRSVCR